MNNKSRASFLALAAFYLLYLAYQLFEGREAPDAGMSLPVCWLFIVIFVLSAAGVLYYAWRMWQQAKKQDEEATEEEQPK